MKKLILFLSLAISLLGVSIATAHSSISVQYPSSFSLSVGDSATVTNYQDMKITLTAIQGVSLLTYPPQTKNTAQIHVSTPGGCPDNESKTGVLVPQCLGAPAFDYDYTLSEGSVVSALGLNIRAVTISNDTVGFEIKLTDDDGIAPNPNPIPKKPAPILEPKPNPDSAKDTVIPALKLPKDHEVISIEKVETVKTSDDTPLHYEVKTKKKFKLFYLLPISAEVIYSVDAKTGAAIVTDRPWWYFLAR